MNNKRGFLRLASAMFKLMAVIAGLAAVAGSVVQLAIYFGFFPADFYFNSTVSSVQNFLLMGGIATLLIGLLPAIILFALARVIDITLDIERRSRPMT
jgi:hypothetical protein